MNEGVHAILAPESIAIVGASDDPTRIGGRPVRILQARGYAGQIFPVNPKYETVQGIRCYPDISSLPMGIHLYIVVLPAAASVDAVEQAAQNGARAVVLFGGGFAETGAEGRALQGRLNAIGNEYGIAILGPNALGAASFVHRAFATFATALETLPDIEPGRIALVSQSGGFAFNIFTEAYWAGARFSHVISTGNEAGLAFADYLAYLAEDPNTDMVMGYLEGVRDGDRFRESLELLRRAGKPLFVIKSGISERASASIASHTAQLSGDDRAFDALFDRYGVTRLSTLDEAVDVARVWGAKLTEGRGIAVATNSGGKAVYVADACARHGVPLAPLTDRTRERLRHALPVFAGLTNPIDITAQIINDRSLLGTSLEIIDQDETVDLIHLVLGSMEYLADEFIDGLLRTRASLRKPLFVSWVGVSDRTRATAAEKGLPLCADPARVVRGLGLAHKGLEALRSSAGSTVPTLSVAVAIPFDQLTPRRLASGRLALDEWQTMQLLESFGVRAPQRACVHSVEDAIAAASEIGYPCVLKLLEPLLPHRALSGAVVTGIADDRGMRAAYERLRRDHQAEVCLVAEQIAGGSELIVGALWDATVGTRAVLGSGGVWVNLVEDARTLVPPYDNAYVNHAFNQLKLAGQLRSSVPNPDRIAPTIAALLRTLAAGIEAANGWISEIECNPVVLTNDGAVILDALAFVETERPR